MRITASGDDMVTGKRPPVFWVPKVVMVVPCASTAVTRAVPRRSARSIWGGCATGRPGGAGYGVVWAFAGLSGRCGWIPTW